MQSRTLVLKDIVLISVAAMFFVASPSFAQQKGASSSEMQTRGGQINDLTLHYIELGQGTPVVLVHGTLEDYRTWDGQLQALSKGYRLISYSRRYHYPNQWPKDSTDFSVTIHARDLAAFIKALNLPPGSSHWSFVWGVYCVPGRTRSPGSHSQSDAGRTAHNAVTKNYT